ncbi:MAG: TrkH family potassium uptake protein [Candidatus Omnitrophota bacterium]
MILRPQSKDLRIIAHFLGKIVLAFGMTMALPFAVAVMFGERVPAIDFLIGLMLSVCVGYALVEIAGLSAKAEMRWMHGMVVVSLSWVVCMFLGAVPLYLSGHWTSYLDACFEAMSGLTTTGLVLVQDLDHLSHAANLWRHLLMFLGGQGIIIVALSFLIKGGPGAFRLYVGEGRDEKIMPNVIETAKFIWLVSFVYLVLGAALLAACGIWSVGMSVREAVFHGLCNFMAAFDTGGFMPQSQNVMYYQSAFYELATVILMIWGGINFNLHYAIWTGRKRELWRDIEIRTFFVTLTLVTILVAVGLAKWHIYPDAFALVRRGLYQVISAHTGTGFQSICAPAFMAEWSSLALIGIILAMGFGASVCSTTGGIKCLRIGIIAKAFKEDIKRFLSPESSVIRTRFRHLRDLFLDDKQVRSALLIALAYIMLFLIGAVIGCFFGHPFLYSLFESTSAAANVGLSCGITQAGMPAVLKVTYILQMWAGRLEFISVLVLGGFMISCLRGR